MFMIVLLSSNNSLMEQKQSTANDSMKTEILKTVQEERAQNRQHLQKIQLLLRENRKLWEQQMKLENTTWDLYCEMDQTRDSISTFNQNVFNSKKVSYNNTGFCLWPQRLSRSHLQ